MKADQTICIRVNGAKGRIISIDDNSIEITWKKENGVIDYGERIRYDLPHIENLVKIGTLIVSDGLPDSDPNLLFRSKELS